MAGESPSQTSSPRDVFVAFLKLGLTSFGGPVAHLGYFREEFVTRRKWLDERSFGDMVALSQFLPGPASSQVGIAVGAARAGLAGALAAWLGFTLPSALALVLFALGVSRLAGGVEAGWLDGLKVVAVAVVARAVWGMARTLCPDRPRATLAILAAIAVLAWPGPPGQITAIAIGGIVGWAFLGAEAEAAPSSLHLGLGRGTAIAFLAVFFALLLALPVAAQITGGLPLKLIDSFYRSGALVFGGGHVILPLLQAEVVPPGWVDKDTFIAGYGAAQAVPGPLLTFSAYLGAMIDPRFGGWPAAGLCLAAAFLPSFLLVLGVLPFWEALRRRAAAQSAMRGVNAAVVGLLLAALYDPVWTSAIGGPADVALAVVAFGLLALWKLPPWLVVGLCGGAGALMAKI
ncbi:MAG: chromate efflux transporter [Alphaproteobacteria bacterium]